MAMIGPGIVFLIPLAIAARAPWCSRFAQSTYHVQLERTAAHP
jgi:hypothetical protein